MRDRPKNIANIVADPGCLYRDPDTGSQFFHPRGIQGQKDTGSGIRIRNTEFLLLFLTKKNCYWALGNMTFILDLGSGFFFPSQGQKCTGSRIRNTDCKGVPLYLKRVEGEEAPCAEVVSHGQGHHTRTVVQGRHLHLLQRKLNLNDDEHSLKVGKKRV